MAFKEEAETSANILTSQEHVNRRKAADKGNLTENISGAK
jgi:hypothetical protein